MTAKTAPRVVYLMTVFPTVVETFTLNEMLMVEQEGIEIIPVSLTSPRDHITHEAARAVATRTHYLTTRLLPLFVANARSLLRAPGRYLFAAFYVLQGHPRSWFTLKRGQSAMWKSLLLFPMLVEMAERLGSLRVQHVHATTAAIAGTAGIILSRLLGRSYSLTGHGQDLWAYPPDDLERRIRRAAFFTTVSEYNRKRLLEIHPQLPAARVLLVRLGIRPEEFGSFTTANDRTDPPGPARLLTVARLEPVKGHDVLIESARVLNRRGLSFIWTLVGDGSRKADLERAAAAAGLGENLRFLGFRTQGEVKELYRQADLFILASRSEGLPVVLMEALASSLPCVATAVGGVPEIVEHGSNGLLVPPDDPTALADAIERLLREHDLRQSMASSGCAAVARDYDIRRTGRSMAELFRASIHPPRDRSSLS